MAKQDQVKKISPSVIKVLGNSAFAPMVLKVGLPELIKLAKETGVAVLAITNSHHMAAMWPETEAIAEAGLSWFCMHILQTNGSSRRC